MNVEIGPKDKKFLFWEYLFRIYGIVSLLFARYLRRTVRRMARMTMMASGMYTPYISPTGVTHRLLKRDIQLHTQSTHRVAMAISSVHSINMEKSAQPSEGGKRTPSPFHTSYHQVQSCSIYAPSEREDALPYFISTPICTLWLHTRRILRSSRPQEICQPPQRGFFCVRTCPVAASRKYFSAIHTSPHINPPHTWSNNNIILHLLLVLCTAVNVRNKN